MTPTRKKQEEKTTKLHSLISDDTLREVYASMVRMRGYARGARAEMRGVEAVLAATTLQVRTGDLIFTPPGLFPPALVAHAAEDALSLVAQEQTDGSHLLLAAGAALSMQDAGKEAVALVFGSAERAQHRVWQQALKLAGVHRLPVLFVLLPQRHTRATMEAAAIASEAVADGVISIPVDTADAVAMYRVAFESLARARRRTGATLIVSTEYALEGGSRRKTPAADPLAHMKGYLKSKGVPPSVKKSRTR